MRAKVLKIMAPCVKSDKFNLSDEEAPKAIATTIKVSKPTADTNPNGTRILVATALLLKFELKKLKNTKTTPPGQQPSLMTKPTGSYNPRASP